MLTTSLFICLAMIIVGHPKSEERESGSTNDKNNPTINKIANIAGPKFLRVYPDDGSGGPRADDVIAEYGPTGHDVWGKPLGA